MLILPTSLEILIAENIHRSFKHLIRIRTASKEFIKGIHLQNVAFNSSQLGEVPVKVILVTWVYNSENKDCMLLKIIACSRNNY